MVKTPIYLDCQATTPLDGLVLDAMLPYLTDHFGNPHSSTHSFGWRAEGALDAAREQVSKVIVASSDEIYFTSGASETNNMVIKGVMELWGKKRPKLVTVATEHKCVLESAFYCAAHGYQLEVLPVEANGILDLDRISDAVDDQTALISVMAVNNEIGVIQPLEEIGKIAKAKGALFHSDAAQAFGKIPLDMDALKLDFLSISGHKIYGPKGVGALYKRAGRSTAMAPFFSGGGQENGIRSGTQAPALVAGLGKAAEIADNELDCEANRTYALANRFKKVLFEGLDGLLFNGDENKRWPGNLNLSFPGIDGDLLLANIRELAVSSGAACASAVSGPSYVLQAIGRSEAEAKSSLRIGFGRFTTEEEVDFAAAKLVYAVSELGGIKP